MYLVDFNFSTLKANNSYKTTFFCHQVDVLIFKARKKIFFIRYFGSIMERIFDQIPSHEYTISYVVFHSVLTSNDHFYA